MSLECDDNMSYANTADELFTSQVPNTTNTLNTTPVEDDTVSDIDSNVDYINDPSINDYFKDDDNNTQSITFNSLAASLRTVFSRYNIIKGIKSLAWYRQDKLRLYQQPPRIATDIALVVTRIAPACLYLKEKDWQVIWRNVEQYVNIDILNQLGLSNQIFCRGQLFMDTLYEGDLTYDEEFNGAVVPCELYGSIFGFHTTPDIWNSMLDMILEIEGIACERKNAFEIGKSLIKESGLFENKRNYKRKKQQKEKREKEKSIKKDHEKIDKCGHWVDRRVTEILLLESHIDSEHNDCVRKKNAAYSACQLLHQAQVIIDHYHEENFNWEIFNKALDKMKTQIKDYTEGKPRKKKKPLPPSQSTITNQQSVRRKVMKVNQKTGFR